MPMIRVEMLPGRSLEQKRDYAKAVTELSAEILGCSTTAVSIVFTEVEREDWATGGVLVSDRTG